jgi:hypothetical protein
MAVKTTKEKRPIQLSGQFGFKVRKRATLDTKGYTIDIALVAETKTGRPCVLVMDQRTFKAFVIDATAEMWRAEHGNAPPKAILTRTGVN